MIYMLQSIAIVWQVSPCYHPKKVKVANGTQKLEIVYPYVNKSHKQIRRKRRSVVDIDTLTDDIDTTTTLPAVSRFRTLNAGT